MSILLFLLQSIIYLFIIFIDLMIFFTVIRIIRQKFDGKWLTKLDTLGKPLIDGFLEIFNKRIFQFKGGQLRDEIKLFISLILFMIIKFIFANFLGVNKIYWVII